MPTELTVVNPFSPAVRRLAARVHVTLVSGVGVAAQTTTRPIIQAYKNIEGPQTVKCFKSTRYCVYFSVSRGERAEYNHWVCFVRLRMIEDWLFVMTPVPLPPLVSKNVRSWVSVHVPGEQGNGGRRSVRGEA